MTKSYTFKVIDDRKNPALWDEKIREIPSSTFFHTNQWLHFIEKQFKAKIIKTIIYKDNSFKGIFSFFEKHYAFLKIAGSPLLIRYNPYMGFALKSYEDNAAFLNSLDTFLKSRRINFFRICFDNDFLHEDLERLGYEVLKKKTYLIDLSQNEELLWKRLGKKGRQLVN